MRPLSLSLAVITSTSCIATLAALGCTQQPTSVAVRSLEDSGAVSFLCLSSDTANPGVALDSCATWYPHTPGTPYNHLFALVTQPIRGEVAAIDISAGSVYDSDKSKPGFNFIPTGANPIDIVSTPGGKVSFVSSASAGSNSIWIIPSSTIVSGPVSLTSFAACALPSAPGKLQVLVQPGFSGVAQSDCAGTPLDAEHKQGDLSQEDQPAGARKLVVSLPDEGMLAVLDAQKLLDHEPGSFRACEIEQYIPLQVQLPASWPQQVWPPDIAAQRAECALTQPVEVSTSSGYLPRPSSFAFDQETATLYVSDEVAPVIHVLDVSDPCSIAEREPLLPRSVEKPEREVLTRGLAVSPTTSDGKKFVYAVDLREGSVMAFDVSVGSTDRTPLIRKNPVTYPFSPPDRLSLSVPVRSVQFALHDTPIADPISGVAQVGVHCDPSDDTSIGAGYRTSADFSTGAGPRNLRGVFAFLALTNGQIVVVDVDDFDAACRRPKETGACAGETYASYQGADGELSCDVVTRHEMRSSTFFDASEASGAWVPQLQSYPVLSLDNSVLATDQTDEGKLHPRMLAPVADKQQAVVLIGGRPVEKVETDPNSSEQNIILFDYREPRVHYEQTWTAAFEGMIPGFDGHVGRFEPTSDSNGRTTFWDSGAFFCDRGVHDLDAARKVGSDRGAAPAGDPAALDAWAQGHVDVLEITSGFLDADDPYWPSVSGRCSLFQCRETFGLVETPSTARDFPIVASYQNRLVVEGVTDFVRCCFPFLPTYTVRAKGQWIVAGTASGFLHAVVPDPASGQCIDTCDPRRKLYSGRAFELSPKTDPVPVFDDPKVYRNPLMQLVIWSGSEPSERNMTFSFTTANGFYPLLVNLASTTSYVQPQSMQYVPQIGQLAIADGAAQGLILVDIASLGVSQTYY